jgi:DNA polymerase elongation subunit (family B)
MTFQKTVENIQKIVPSTLDCVVAVEAAENGSALIYRRPAKSPNTVTIETIPYHPHILLMDPSPLNGSELEFETVPLNGTAKFACAAIFADAKTHKKALDHLKRVTGMNPSSPMAPYKNITDSTQQLLVAKEFRLFRNMTFNDIRRMQFDIETLTTPGYEFPNAKRAGDQIAMIAMSDNTGWSECLVLNNPFSEKELLEEFVKIVVERDPDVLEGHNVFKFDLPFIETRAKRYKVKLNLGRSATPTTPAESDIPLPEFPASIALIKKRPSRLNIAERTITYPKYEIFGRHIVDTFHLVQHYDVTHRELDGYGLKSVAKHFGVAAPDRTYVEGAEISAMFAKSPETLAKYAIDDVLETEAIARILAPTFFHQTQLIPISYQNCVVRGNASRIESMLLAAYFAERHSVPSPEPPRPFSGALTAAQATGRFENVWHCDVRSLYPSIILAENLIPSRDELGIFTRFLDKLRTFRLATKDAARSADISDEERDTLNSLQTTFKILINSFYGYLGFSQGSFNDYAMAERVTSRGREILTSMLEYLESQKATVIEMDTDGIYFQPPSPPSEGGMCETNRAIIAKMESGVQSILPSGIEVELDSVHPAMFCYKSKNYALLNDEGETLITGAALKSRGLEPFQRSYLKSLMSYLLKGDYDAITKMSDDYEKSISSHDIPLAKLAKTETLKDSPENYRKKLETGKGRRSAAYELALKSDRAYDRGDQISYYVTGTKKKVSVVENSKLLADADPNNRDENTLYYLGKLTELSAKFAEFIPKSEKEQQMSEEENPLGLVFD